MRDGFRFKKKGKRLFIYLTKIGWFALTRRGGNPYPDGVSKEFAFEFMNGKWKVIVQYEIDPPQKTENGRFLGLDRNNGQHSTSEVASEDVTFTEEGVEVVMENILTNRYEYLHNKNKKHPNQAKDEKCLKRLQRIGAGRRRDTSDSISRIRRRIKDQNHKLSCWIADLVETVYIEDMEGKNMTASTRGTIENPGKNVKRKAGLNAAILLMAWYQLFRMLDYKRNTVIALHTHHPSQMCSRCAHVDKANRLSQAVFRCVKCNHPDHADVNAAMNILLQGLELTHVNLPGNLPRLFSGYVNSSGVLPFGASSV